MQRIKEFPIIKEERDSRILMSYVEVMAEKGADDATTHYCVYKRHS